MTLPSLRSPCLTVHNTHAAWAPLRVHTTTYTEQTVITVCLQSHTHVVCSPSYEAESGLAVWDGMELITLTHAHAHTGVFQSRTVGHPGGTYTQCCSAKLQKGDA